MWISIRKSWLRLQKSFFTNAKNVPRGLPDMERAGISRGLDEKLPETISKDDNIMAQEQQIKTREEIFSESTFEWIKTERFGDICKFKKFEEVDGREMIVFDDDTRIFSNLLGDLVLQHKFQNEVLGSDLNLPAPNHTPVNISQIPPDMTPEDAAILGYGQPLPTPPASNTPIQKPASDNPVISLLEKSKKKNKVLTLNLSVKIPTNELYNVIHDNFDDVDNIILDDVIAQIDTELLRAVIAKELHNIYSKKIIKKTTTSNGK